MQSAHASRAGVFTVDELDVAEAYAARREIIILLQRRKGVCVGNRDFFVVGGLSERGVRCAQSVQVTVRTPWSSEPSCSKRPSDMSSSDEVSDSK